MKRLLSLILSVAMLCTMIIVPSVSASADTAYPDHVPGEIPPNMIKTVSELGGVSAFTVSFGRTTEGRLSYAYSNNYKGYTITAKGEAGGPMTGTAPKSEYTNGFYIATGIINGNGFKKADGSDTGDIAGNKSYVYKLQVRNLNPDIIPNVHMKLYDYDAGGGSQYDIEHGESGMAVTSTDWMDFQGTIFNKDDSHVTQTINGRDVFSFGFPTSGTLAGSSVDFNTADESNGKYRPYIAEEVAYDITNTLTSASSEVTTATSATFRAEVTNQIGSTGYLDQTFTWMALDKATRTQYIPGIIITPSADTTTATVTVIDTAEPGTYDIVAYSEKYDMAKGYTITVDVPSKYIDHIAPEITDNLINKVSGTTSDLQYIGVDNDGTDNKDTTDVVEGNNVRLSHIYASSYFTVKSPVAYDGSTKVGKAPYRHYGAIISDAILTQKPANDTNYVIKFAVRKNESSPADTKMVFVAHDADNYSVNHYSKNYGSNGLTLTSADWVTYKDTLKIPAKHEQLANRTNVPLLENVFTTDALAGTSFDISWKAAGTEPFYLAVEKAHDIKNTLVSGSANAKFGDTIKLKAEVVNQIDDIGYLKQNFIWRAYDNATRKKQADGIEITPSRDTTRATVFIGDGVPAGEYAIVAYSEDYSMAKGFVINVTDAQVLSDYTPGAMPANRYYNDAGLTGRWLATFQTIHPSHAGGITGVMRYPIEASPQYWGATSTIPIAGGEMTASMNKYVWQAKNYVFSTQLRNAPDATVQNSKFGYMISSSDGTSTSQPYKILDITSSEWQTFKFVLPVTVAGTTSSKLHFGYPQAVADRNPQGTEIQHKMGSVYISEEVPYDIDVSASDTTLRAGEGSISLNAQVLNQLEIPFEGTTDIEWYVANEHRTSKVDGFTLSVSDDGMNVTVSASKTVPHGKYVVFAEDNSLGVDGFRKGIEINVLPLDTDMTEEGAVIYVSPDGDDDDYGTKARPLATLNGALNKIEELHANDITVSEVIFRGGDYRINANKITDLHSGTANKSIVFKSYPGEKAYFKGSVELDMSMAEHVTNTELLNRMYPSVHDKVVVIDLEKQGIKQTDITSLTAIDSIYTLNNSSDYNTVYVDGVEQPIAQWPNGREYTTWEPKYSWYITDKLKGTRYTHQMGYSDGDKPDRWANATEWWVSVFPAWDFTRYRLSPESIDTSKNVIYYPESTVELTSDVSRRWKAYNLLEEIDLPGEFYIDRANMLLYFYPPYDTEDAKVEFSTSRTLLSVSKASNITFEDLHFTQNTGTAVIISDVVNVDFENCSFTNIGFKGLVNSGSKKPITGGDYWQNSYIYMDSSYGSDVRGCLFDNCGGVSLQLSGGNTDTLEPSGNIIENNIITRSNQRSLVDSSMLVAGVGNIVRNNNFGKSTQHAITIIGNDHLIEKNEIHNVLREVADAGAIYQGRNQMQRGTTISSNLIHDIWPVDSKLVSGTVGVYMDDGHQGNTIKNNFFIGTKTGYNSHGAAAQKILNNIMVDTNSPWTFPGNPNTSTETKAKGGTNDWDMKDGVADKVRSTMYSFDTNTDSVDEFISNIHDIDLYRTRYPELADWIDTNKNPHSYTVFDGNISVDGKTTGSMCWDDTNFAQIGSNPTDYTKDIFVNPDDLDYRVKSTSEAAIANPDLLSDANFDMDWVGVQSILELNNTTAPFKLLYPTSDEPVGTAVELFWEDALMANRYEVTVATDAQFKNKVVDSEEVHNNIFYLSGLTAGTRYYWKVTAKNTSRDFRSEWESEVNTFFVSDITLTNTALTQTEDMVWFDMNVSSPKSYNATVYTLAYDSEGNIRAIDKQDKAISSTSQKLTVSFDTKGEYAIDYVKILVWNKGDVTPLRAAKVLKK